MRPRNRSRSESARSVADQGGQVQISLQPVDLQEVLNACAKIVRGEAEKHDHQLTVEPSAQPIFVRSDPGAHRRAVCVIIENAVKFTPDRGLIRLRGGVEKMHAVIEIEEFEAASIDAVACEYEAK